MTALRLTLALLILASLYFTFWPVPVEPIAWDAPVDAGLVDPFSENDQLAKAKGIGLGKFHGPEDIVIGFDNLLYAATNDGNIISFQADGSDLKVFAVTGGRPLGMDYTGGFLYVANAYLGLQRIRRDGRVVVVADTFDGQPIGYADDVAVAKDGTVYFTDASSKFGAQSHGGSYEAAVLDLIEHGSHGRVLKYDPFNNETTLVLDQLDFANGIAISEDQSYLLVNETGSYRVVRFWLEGPNAGTREIILDNLPGFPDNINNGLHGRFWIGLIAPRDAVVDRYSNNPFVRKMMLRLPKALHPKAKLSSHLIAIDGGGNVLMNFQDTDASFPSITGAIETRDNLYLTSLFGNRIARLAKRDLR